MHPGGEVSESFEAGDEFWGGVFWVGGNESEPPGFVWMEFVQSLEEFWEGHFCVWAGERVHILTKEENFWEALIKEVCDF